MSHPSRAHGSMTRVDMGNVYLCNVLEYSNISVCNIPEKRRLKHPVASSSSQCEKINLSELAMTLEDEKNELLAYYRMRLSKWSGIRDWRGLILKEEDIDCMHLSSNNLIIGCCVQRRKKKKKKVFIDSDSIGFTITI